MSQLTPLDLIESARLRVWNRHPYIGSVLMSLRLVEMPGIGTLAVDAGWRLYYDPVQCEKWGVEMLAGVVAHECWHVLRDHFTRMPQPEYEKQLSNIAQDVEINSDLKFAGWKLPDGVFPLTFAVKPGLLAEEYYRLLQNKVVKVTIGVCAGKCGGCAGNPHDFELPMEGDGKESDKNVKPIPKWDREVIRRQAAIETAEASKKAGDVPAGLAAWAERELKPPTIDWRRQLAGLVRRAVTAAAGSVDHTYRKQSRRGAGLRHYLGAKAPILPALYRPIPAVGMILDVSGSMMGGPAEAARSEILGIVRAVGCSLEVFLADVKVAGKSQVSNAKDIAALGETLGGTDLGSAVREVGAMRKHDVLIVLTDGYTGWHAPGDVRCTVLAAITPGGDAPPDWIKAVRMV
jgi:predicted metal-dependent peptidase